MSDPQDKKKYRRSPSTATKRKWLSLYFEENISVQSIADDYGYPVATVYRVLRKMDPNKDERADKGKKRKSPTVDIDFEKLILEGESPETQLEMFIQEMLRAISKKKSIALNSAVTYVNQLTNAYRRLRSVQIGALAKSLDVKIVERIIRRYEPEATPMRIIEVCKEVIAEAKAEKNE
jgi:hypothetical protein